MKALVAKNNIFWLLFATSFYCFRWKDGYHECQDFTVRKIPYKDRHECLCVSNNLFYLLLTFRAVICERWGYKTVFFLFMSESIWCEHGLLLFCTANGREKKIILWQLSTDKTLNKTYYANIITSSYKLSLEEASLYLTT